MKRVILFVFLLVTAMYLFTAERAVGEPSKHTEKSSYTVEDYVGILDSDYYAKRILAFEQLLKLQSEAEPLVIDRIRQHNSLPDREKELLFALLLEYCTRASIDALSEIYEITKTASKFNDVRQKGEWQRIEALLNRCDKRRIETIFKLTSLSSSFRVFVDETLLQLNLEGELLSLIPSRGNAGYFHNQMKDTAALGQRILPYLKDIINDKYTFLSAVETDKNLEAYSTKLKEVQILAVRAFTEFPEHKDTIVPFLENLVKENNLNFLSSPNHIAKEVFFTLFAFGRQQYIKNTELEIERQSIWSKEYSNSVLTNIYIRTNRSERARQMLLDTLKEKNNLSDYSKSITWYNIACIYSEQGNIDEAIDAMEKCFGYGYDEVEWVMMDGDIKPLFDKPRFMLMLKRKFPSYDFNKKSGKENKDEDEVM